MFSLTFWSEKSFANSTVALLMCIYISAFFIDIEVEEDIFFPFSLI